MIHAATATDGYKLSHGSMYPKGTQFVYSNLTPRGDKHYSKNATKFYDGKLVWVGAQGAIKEIQEIWDKFFQSPKEKVLGRFSRQLQNYLGGFDPAVKQLSELHDLGYLPLHFKSLPEGSKVPMGVPVLTVSNTKEEFFWLVNYLETVISAMTWKTATAATVAAEYKAICNHYAKLTGTDDFTVSVQCHDFSMRGMSGVEDAARTGFGHLTQFIGTDSLVSIDYAEDYYNAKELIAISVPATEHAVATSNILYNETSESGLSRLGAEKEFLKELITERFPEGIISYVSDSFDFWGLVTKVLPELKDEIRNRKASKVAPAKLVIRPDSGDPVKVITGYKVYPCDFSTEDKFYSLTDGDSKLQSSLMRYELVKVAGEYRTFDMVDPSRVGLGNTISEAEAKGAIQCLWEIFGGAETSTGHKLLDSSIGLIYGDSITPSRAEQILQRLMDKGFASGNVVLGVGSMSYQFHTRDTFGFAVKATHIIVNDKSVPIFKMPMGDASKASAKGLLFVDSEMKLTDNVTMETESSDENLLKSIFIDGKFVRETSLEEIRDKLKAQTI